MGSYLYMLCHKYQVKPHIHGFQLLRAYSRKIIWALIASQIIFPAKIMLFRCLILGFVSLYVKAKTVWLQLLLIWLTFHMRVVHFCGMLKKNYLHEISVHFNKIFLSQAYLIWAPKLDVPKIGKLQYKWI